MNSREAFEEMGLTSSATREEIRRAYLKLLKTRKPDADKAAFMRLREAYEILTSRSEVIGAFEIELPSPPKPAPQSTKAFQTADEPKPEPEPQRELDPRDAVSPPHDPTLSDPDELLERLGAKATVALYIEALDRSTRDVVDPGFSPSTASRLILLLQWSDKPASARRLIESYAAWLKATGSELRILRSDAAGMWVVARELAALGEGMPFEMKRYIAAAALDGDLSLARENLALTAQLPAHSVRLAAIRAALARNAPSLHRAYGPALQKVRTKRGTAPFFLLLVMMFGAFRYCSRASQPDAPEYQPPSDLTRSKPALTPSTVLSVATSATLPATDPSNGSAVGDVPLNDPAPLLEHCSEKIRELAKGPYRSFYRNLAADVPSSLDLGRCEQARKDVVELHSLGAGGGLADAIAECDRLVEEACTKRGPTK